MRAVKESRRLRRERAPHRARRDLDDRRLAPEARRRRRDFKADEARADHDDAPRGAEAFAKDARIIEVAQHENAVEPDPGNIERPLPRSRRKHEMAVIEARA